MQKFIAILSDQLIISQVEGLKKDNKLEDSLLSLTDSLVAESEKCSLSKSNQEAACLVLVDIGTIDQVSLQISQNKIANRIKLILLNTAEEPDKYLLRLKENGHIFHMVNFKPETLELKLKQILKAHQEFESGVAIDSMLRQLFQSTKDVHEKKLVVSSERWDFYESLGEFSQNLDCFPEFPEIVKTISSELITNAFYDAPRSFETSQPLCPDRKAIVSIPPPEHVDFHYGVDGQYLWLAVRDPFGTLDRTVLTNAIYRAVKDKKPILDGIGGAGLGLAMICSLCTEVMFVLDYKKQTFVACKLLLTKRNRVFTNQTVDFHIF